MKQWFFVDALFFTNNLTILFIKKNLSQVKVFIENSLQTHTVNIYLLRKPDNCTGQRAPNSEPINLIMNLKNITEMLMFLSGYPSNLKI